MIFMLPHSLRRFSLFYFILLFAFFTAAFQKVQCGEFNDYKNKRKEMERKAIEYIFFGNIIFLNKFFIHL